LLSKSSKTSLFIILNKSSLFLLIIWLDYGVYVGR